MWGFFFAKTYFFKTPIWVIVLAFCLAILPACETTGYYMQSVIGQGKVLLKRRPIAEILAEKDIPPELRTKLVKVSQIRDYAIRRLGLPASQSFRGYVTLNRPYVIWSVVAAPKFSLTAKKWCYPIVGCASYRGYFSQISAHRYATELRENGLETSISGVPAYSTLGWFADPIYSPILKWSETRIARLIFHELAHEQLYVAGDSNFNEAFASAVAEIGVDLWLQDEKEQQAIDHYFSQQRQESAVYKLLQEAATELKAIYQTHHPKDWKKKAKKDILARLTRRYNIARDSDWNGDKGYERWFNPPPNNAQLASIGTYRRYLPVFRALYQQVNQDLAAFYREAAILAEKSSEIRKLYMESWLDSNSNQFGKE